MLRGRLADPISKVLCHVPTIFHNKDAPNSKMSDSKMLGHSHVDRKKSRLPEMVSCKPPTQGFVFANDRAFGIRYNFLVKLELQ